jgi:Metallo-peptidase family M12
MKKTIHLIILFFTICQVSKAQVINNVLPLWKNSIKKTAKDLGQYNDVQLDIKVVNDLYDKKSAKISLPLKDENNNDIIADMELKPMDDVRIKLNNVNYTNDIVLPLLYKGKIRGLERKNNVMLTIAPGYISLQAILPDVIISVEKEDKPASASYILYNSKEMKLPEKPFSCGMPAPAASDIQRLQMRQIQSAGKVTTASDKCVFVFVDCTEALYTHYGSNVQNTINNIYSIWNDVRTAYNNEQLNVAISEVNVWTTTVPFNTSTRELGIQTFAAYYQNNYWGNMAMLLDWTPGLNGNSGVAGGYGWAKGIAPNVCGNYNPNPNPPWNHGSFIYNDLNYFGNYQNFPVPARAQEVYIFIHEIGHLLGSFHTHSCNWLLSTNPNVFGAIDNCAPVEGVCSPGPAPVNGGTFMSYCIGPGQFMNFNKGFGPLPGQAIRAFVDGNDCLTNCITCVANMTIGSIPLQGIYQYEASNQITANGVINGNSSTIVKIDAGNKIFLEPGFKAIQGGKVKIFIDGCGGIR